jgi:hypothetical protein
MAQSKWFIDKTALDKSAAVFRLVQDNLAGWGAGSSGRGGPSFGRPRLLLWFDMDHF